MDEFENKVIRGIHTSRYLASWEKSGWFDKSSFIKWLESLTIDDGKLTDDEIRYIVNFATNGKLELQEIAKKFRQEQIDKLMKEADIKNEPKGKLSDKRKERAAQKLAKEVIKMAKDYCDYLEDDEFGERLCALAEPEINRIKSRKENK